MNKQIFTIGYAGILLPRFLDLLKKNSVSMVVDVRSVPRSQYFSNFNDKNIKHELEKVGMKYENWQSEFGARRSGEIIIENQNEFEKRLAELHKCDLENAYKKQANKIAFKK